MFAKLKVVVYVLKILRAAVCKNRESQFSCKNSNFFLSRQKNSFSELILGKILKSSFDFFSERYFQKSKLRPESQF